MSTPDKDHPYANLSPEELFEGFKAAGTSNGRRAYFHFIQKVQASNPTFLQRFIPLAQVSGEILWDVALLVMEAPVSKQLVEPFRILIDYAFEQEEAASTFGPEIVRKGLYKRLRDYVDWGHQLAPILVAALKREQWVNEPLDELINAIIITGKSSWGLYLSEFKIACSEKNVDIRECTPTTRVINGLSRALLGMGAPIDQIVPLIPKPPGRSFKLW